MEKACEQLGFAVHRQHNDVTQARVVSLLEEANKMEYPTSYKRLIFVFCGHGEEGGIIVTSEQKKILTAEIISTLSQDKLKTMPRLFFFDVCRGKENDTGIILPVPRGGNTMRTVRVPKAESNYLVAYSTINGYRSFELPKESGYKEGGIWMQHVAAKLASANMSISDLLTSVNGEMRELFDKHKEMEYVQQPEMILRLNDTVNLVKEAIEAGWMETSVPAHATTMNSTSRGYPGHNPPQRDHSRHQSSPNSVAEPCPVPDPTSQVQVPAATAAGAASLPSPSKVEDHMRGVPRSQHVTLLKNYIQDKMKQPLPNYKVTQIGSKFQCTIQHALFPEFTGNRCKGKSEAKQSAAGMAVVFLKNNGHNIV